MQSGYNEFWILLDCDDRMYSKYLEKIDLPFTIQDCLLSENKAYSTVCCLKIKPIALLFIKWLTGGSMVTNARKFHNSQTDKNKPAAQAAGADPSR